MTAALLIVGAAVIALAAAYLGVLLGEAASRLHDFRRRR